MRFRRLSTGAWKISPCNTYLPAAPGYVMVESRQLARLKAERQKNHQLKVRMSDSIKQNSQFSLPLNFAPTTGTTACEAIHWTPSMDTLPRPALAPPPSPATTPSPATAPAETPGPVSAMSVSLSVPPAPAGFIDLDDRHRQRNATPHQKVRPALNPHRNPHQARKGGKEQPENNSNRNMSLCSYLPSPGPDQGGCSQLRGSHGPASGSSATRVRIVIRTRPI